jgi:Cysteine rich repeat
MLVMLAGPAFAQQPTQAQANAIRQACRADYQAHCASVPTGGSAALSCLQQNASSLSPGCQSALAAVSHGNATSAPSTAVPAPGATPVPPMTPREELALMRQACGPDYRTFCSGVRAGGGRALACLEDHSASLFRPCRSALMTARQNR